MAYGVVTTTNGYAYIADGTDGLQIVDFANPASPIRVGGCDTGGTARGIAISGNTVYVADDQGGLVIFTVDQTNRPGDLNGDGKVDWMDMAIFFNHWLDSSCADPNWCSGADLNKSGTVNFSDFAMLAGYGVWPPNGHGDFNHDGWVDWLDLRICVLHWLESDCSEPQWCDNADTNHSGAVDFTDYAVLAAHWLE